jgi:zinc protease
MRMTLALSVCAVLVIGAHSAAADPLRLDNGLTVFLWPIAEADRVNVLVVFGLGQDHDPAGKSGRAHLLEHLYVHSAAGDRPAETVEQRSRRFPMGSNAQTGFDYTWISTTCRPEELEGEITDAAARMSDLRIAQADLDQEKPRILQEVRNMYFGIPQLAGVNNVRLRVRPRPDGGRYGGDDEVLNTMTVQELQDLWREYYKPNNAILTIVGKFDPAVVRKLIEAQFAPIPAGKPAPARIVPAAAKTGPPHRIQLQPITPGAKPSTALGYVVPWPGTSDYPAFLVLLARLYTDALSQQGDTPASAASFPIYFAPFDDGTVLILQSPVEDPAQPEAVIARLQERLKVALERPVQPEDAARVQQMFGPFLGTFEIPDAMWAKNPHGLGFSLARRYQLGLAPDSLKQAIEAVTDEDLKHLGQTVFDANRRVAVVAELP